MAININIDNQLGLEYTFRIAGKKRELVYDDECALEIQRVELTVNKAFQSLEKMDEDEFNEMPVEEQLDFSRDKYAEMRNAIIPFFDKYFGDDAGQEIYEYCHNSTRGLATVFGEINKYLDQTKIKSKTKK